MKSLAFVLLLSGIASQVWSADGAQHAPATRAVQFDGVAAYVNSDIITIDEVMREVRKAVNFGIVPEAERPALLREAYARMLDLMIDRKLMLKFYNESKMKLQPTALDNHIRDILASSFNGEQALFEAALQREGITREQWRKITEENLILTMLRYTQIDKKLNITPADIRAYYAAHKDEFTTPGGVKMSMILIPGSEAETIEKALAELKEGKPFAEVAKRYSKDSRANEGGSWGTIDPKEMFSETIVQALAALKPGEYSQAVQLADQNYILYKEAEIGTTPLSLSDAWQQVEEKLREERYRERMEAWIKSLRAKAVLKINALSPL